MRFKVEEVYVSGYGHHIEFWIRDTIKDERLCMCKWRNVAHEVCSIMNTGAKEVITKLEKA